MRFLFYSHHDVGFGNTRRHLALATKLAATTPGASVVFAVGRDGISPDRMPPGVELARLPALRDVTTGVAARYLPAPEPARVALRAQMLESLVRLHRPAVLVVDGHPLGACGELRSALDALHEIGGRAVLGMPDASDPQSLLREWSPAERAAAAQDYERVFVYGQPLSVGQRASSDQGLAARFVVGEFSATMDREEPALFVARQPRLCVVAAARHHADDGFALLDRMHAGVAAA